jgi:peptide-methionine (R)-S-oxide reductase
MPLRPVGRERLLKNQHLVLVTACGAAIALVLMVALPRGVAIAQQSGTGTGAGQADAKTGKNARKSDAGDRADDDSRPKKVVKTDSEWMKTLSREQFRVTRKKQPERPFTGNLWKNNKDGVYVCVCCSQPLFDSKEKFDAKNGYPCFKDPIDEDAVGIASDKKRIECTRCDANLGQVITSGAQAGAAPQQAPAAGHAQPPGIGAPPPAAGQAPGQQRYCLNNQSIKFIPRADFEKTHKKGK